MRLYFTAAIFVVAFISAPAISATSVSNADLLKRMDELSRVMSARNKTQIRFQSQLDGLSQELNQMRGSMEVFSNQLEKVEERQRNLYQLINARDPKAATTSSSSVSSAEKTAAMNDKSVYQAAVDLVLNDKQYQKAIIAFRAFVVDQPGSIYVPNAQYWLGQLLYKEKKRSEARAAFLVVAEKYPTSNKRADSLFKIGLIDEYSGLIDSAKVFYQKTISEYPESSAAGLAAKRLNEL